METALVLANPQELQATHAAWITRKKEELADCEKALDVYRNQDGVTPRQIRRVKEKVAFLSKVIVALEKGYLPIPRFDTSPYSLQETDMPVPVSILLNVEKARRDGVFTEIRLVEGRAQGQRQGPYPALGRRDPLIVGVIKHGTLQWGYEEHFLLGWWRPEDMRPSDLV